MEDCIFCKIIAGEIPSTKVWEDDNFFAFKDINPVAPVHVLVIPKKHIQSIADLTPDDAAAVGQHPRHQIRFLVIGLPEYKPHIVVQIIHRGKNPQN